MSKEKKKRRTRLEVAKDIFEAMTELEEIEKKRDDAAKVWLDGQDEVRREHIKEAHKRAKEQTRKETEEKEKAEIPVE